MSRHAAFAVEGALPVASVLDRQLIDTAYFYDCYRVSLSRRDASVAALFFAVFGHHPYWMKRVLVARNVMARLFGLETSSAASILAPVPKNSYAVGDLIGPWPVFHISPTELVAGRNNRHLDFRLSVLQQVQEDSVSVYISTVCTTHNACGRLYLTCMVPFHKWGVQHLFSNAVAAGRR